MVTLLRELGAKRVEVKVLIALVEYAIPAK
jgi:hypothetical protein